ncbi:MAG: CoA transferase, partial [Gammaproteobacteria bacterium]
AVARGMVREVDDPILGRVQVPGFPFKFSAQPEVAESIAPLLGEHNAQVLGGLLGLDADAIAALAADGVLHSAPC